MQENGLGQSKQFLKIIIGSQFFVGGGEGEILTFCPDLGLENVENFYRTGKAFSAQLYMYTPFLTARCGCGEGKRTDT